MLLLFLLNFVQCLFTLRLSFYLFLILGPKTPIILTPIYHINILSIFLTNPHKNLLQQFFFSFFRKFMLKLKIFKRVILKVGIDCSLKNELCVLLYFESFVFFSLSNVTLNDFSVGIVGDVIYFAIGLERFLANNYHYLWFRVWLLESFYVSCFKMFTLMEKFILHVIIWERSDGFTFRCVFLLLFKWKFIQRAVKLICLRIKQIHLLYFWPNYFWNDQNLNKIWNWRYNSKKLRLLIQ